MKRFAVLLIGFTAISSASAMAEEVDVRVGPADTTVRSTPDTVGSGAVVRETEVIREREPRDREVTVEEHREAPVVGTEKKTIIQKDE
jgi:hypothetical protein